MKIHIRNMVCARCVAAVDAVLRDQGLHPVSVRLGEAELAETALSPEEVSKLDAALNAIGFSRIDSRQGRLVEQIRQFVIEAVRNASGPERENWSDRIAAHFHTDYSHLSGLFSSMEGISLEQYIIRQKIERVKELLVYDEMTLGEIAFLLGYSSTAHLSSQFKKVTGLTPSHFRSVGGMRRPLDQV